MDPQQNIPNPNTVLQAPLEAGPQAPQPLNTEVVAQPNVEQAPVQMEAAPVPGQAAAVAQPLQQMPAQQPAAAPPAQTVHVGSVAGRTLHDPSLQNLPAADEDLIEKEWVDKAEEVISNDQDNPRAEDEHQHEMSKVYLKKRFNLDVS